MDLNKKYYIEYRVDGFIGKYKQGPYEYKDLEYQAKDIESYEGVYSLRIVPADINAEED